MSGGGFRLSCRERAEKVFRERKIEMLKSF
jgi:hypothetical protein